MVGSNIDGGNMSRTSVLPTSESPRSQEPKTTAPERNEAWWKIHLFRGMINDVRRRAPYYASDWIDAWDYRIIPATVYMYFAKYVSYSVEQLRSA